MKLWVFNKKLDVSVDKSLLLMIGLLIVFENDRLTIVFGSLNDHFQKRLFHFCKKLIVFENNPLVLNC